MRRYGISAYDPCLVLVLGRGRERRFEWTGRRAALPKVKIVSFDHLFEEDKRLCQDIGELERWSDIAHG